MSAVNPPRGRRTGVGSSSRCANHAGSPTGSPVDDNLLIQFTISSPLGSRDGRRGRRRTPLTSSHCSLIRSAVSIDTYASQPRLLLHSCQLVFYRRVKILESACMNSWSPRAQRVNVALFGAHSRKYMRRLWSVNIVTSVAKTKFLNFRKWVKWALILIFCTRL